MKERNTITDIILKIRTDHCIAAHIKQHTNKLRQFSKLKKSCLFSPYTYSENNGLLLNNLASSLIKGVITHTWMEY